jgi:hypothetical protein
MQAQPIEFSPPGVAQLSAVRHSVGGAASDRDRLVLGAGLDYKPMNDMRFSLNYAATLSKAQSTHVVGASFGIDF